MPTVVTIQEVADLLAQGLCRKHVARQLGTSVETVNRRMKEGGLTAQPTPAFWTDAEMDIMRSGAFDGQTIEAVIAALSPRLPGRSPKAIRGKLTEVRAALSATRRARPVKGEPPPPVTRRDPPAAGTYRDRRGITLKALSCMEARP